MADENDDIEYPDSESEQSQIEEEEEEYEGGPSSAPKKKSVVLNVDEEEVEDMEDEDDDDDDEDMDDIENEDDLLNTIQQTDVGEKAAFVGMDNFSDDEEEEEEDSHYLQKFNKSIQKNIIADYHPELQTHNYEEIETLCRVVRDAEGNIIDPMHKTLPFLSRYEKARILGERAKQIDNGAKAFVEVDENVIDGYLIAVKEFEMKKIPFIIKRPLPNGTVEYWRFSDLIVLE